MPVHIRNKLTDTVADMMLGEPPTSIGELPVTPRNKSGDTCPLSVRVFKYFHDIYISQFAQPQVFLHAQRGTTPTEHREKEFHNYSLIFMDQCIVDDSVQIPTRCSFVIEFIIPKFFEGSTCFERHTAHHQEV